MIHIAICDAKQNEVTVLKNQLHNMCEEICEDSVHISVFSNTFALMTYVIDEVKGQVDIIFMEVCQENFDGISAAETILNTYPHIKIIFMSDNIENSKDIFRVNPIYFLLKPFDNKYLHNAFSKAVRLVGENNIDIIRIGNGIGKNRILTIKMSNICYIKSDKRKITFHMENEQYSCYMKLDDVSKKLGKNFIRVHQSFVVNMDKIKGVQTGSVILHKDVVIPVSTSRGKEVMKSVREYMNIS